MGEAYAASAAVRARTTEAFMMILLSVERLELSERARLIKCCIGVGGCCNIKNEALMMIRISLRVEGHREGFIQHGESPVLLVVGSRATVCDCRLPSLSARQP